MKLSIKIAFK